MALELFKQLTFYQVLTILGFTTLPSAFVGALISKLVSKNRETKALKSGIQALLRDRLLERYHQAMAHGSTTYADRASFDNMYQQYHNLGANGVMNKVYEEFMDLPMKGELNHE